MNKIIEQAEEKVQDYFKRVDKIKDYNQEKVLSAFKKYKIGLKRDIDFEKVKDAGVEFVFIRVGSQRGIGGEYYVDSKFEQNMKGFQKAY